MARLLSRLIYGLLLLAALPLVPLRLWWRGRKEPGYRRHIGERFGAYPVQIARPVIWLHAVSVGETRAAQPLVRALRERYPDHALVITQMTAAGRETAASLYGADATICFLPYDFPFAVRRFLAHFHPRLGIVMETEVWPNLLRACRERGIPMLLANARLSERSARGYARFGALAREAFGAFTATGAQTTDDAKRLAALGATPVEVTGNIKFDVEAGADQSALGDKLRHRCGGRLIALFASTREGEETLLLDALGRRPLERAVVMIVPRHPQRFDEVATLLSRRGLAFVRRSEDRAVPADADFLLGDSMGEMAAYYAACDVAFIGGSLLDYGAQNLIEACAAGAPVLIGPSAYNFAQAAALAIESGAALRVRDADDLIGTMHALLADEPRRQRMSAAGRAFSTAHRGATARTMALVERLMAKR